MNWEVVPYLGFGLIMLVGLVAAITIWENGRRAQ